MTMALSADSLRFILGLKLKKLRQERGLSLKQVAEKARVSISYLSEIEKGRKYPKPERLLQLAQALEVSFDDLVSLELSEELDPLREVFGSELVHEFPFRLFGFEPEDLFGLMTHVPEKANALIRTFLEVGKTYDLQVEQFLLAALRSYQQMNANYFHELEEEASALRRERGWAAGEELRLETLRRELTERWGYNIDEETLSDHRELSGLRSVLAPGAEPRLFVNGRLLPSQKAFVLAREIGYRHLGLEARALTSSWLKIESFEQLLNNFKASYFAGALLIDREVLRRDLERLFSGEAWDSEALRHLLRRHNATPEMLLYRLTELVPELFGLDEIYFLRFHHSPGSEEVRLTKIFNLSRVTVPRGIGLKEHYCRRWSALRLLRRMAAGSVPRDPGGCAIGVQRSHFMEEDAEFFELAMARPLALSDDTNAAVCIGFLVGDTFKRRVRFWNHPAIPRVEVNLTCERCRLAPEACHERVAPPELVWRQQEQERKGRAVAALLEASPP